MEKVADQMTNIVLAVDEADQACIDCAEAVEELRALDKTIADIEETTGIPAKRINQLRSQARALLNEDEEGDEEEHGGNEPSEEDGQGPEDESEDSPEDNHRNEEQATNHVA